MSLAVFVIMMALHAFAWHRIRGVVDGDARVLAWGILSCCACLIAGSAIGVAS